MKLLRYNEERKEYHLEVIETLDDRALKLLRKVNGMEHGQWPTEDLYAPRHDTDMSQEGFDQWNEVYNIVMWLTDVYLLERTTIGPFNKPVEVYKITDLGKLLLKMIDKQLAEKGTTYP